MSDEPLDDVLDAIAETDTFPPQCCPLCGHHYVCHAPRAALKKGAVCSPTQFTNGNGGGRGQRSSPCSCRNSREEIEARFRRSLADSAAGQVATTAAGIRRSRGQRGDIIDVTPQTGRRRNRW